MIRLLPLLLAGLLAGLALQVPGAWTGRPVGWPGTGGALRPLLLDQAPALLPALGSLLALLLASLAGAALLRLLAPRRPAGPIDLALGALPGLLGAALFFGLLGAALPAASAAAATAVLLGALATTAGRFPRGGWLWGCGLFLGMLVGLQAAGVHPPADANLLLERLLPALAEPGARLPRLGIHQDEILLTAWLQALAQTPFGPAWPWAPLAVLALAQTSAAAWTWTALRGLLPHARRRWALFGALWVLWGATLLVPSGLLFPTAGGIPVGVALHVGIPAMLVAGLLLLRPDWTRGLPAWAWAALGAIAAPTYPEAVLLLALAPLWVDAGARRQPWGAVLLLPAMALALLAVWPPVFRPLGAVPLLAAAILAALVALGTRRRLPRWRAWRAAGLTLGAWAIAGLASGSIGEADAAGRALLAYGRPYLIGPEGGWLPMMGQGLPGLLSPSPYCGEGRGRLCASPHDLALLLGLPWAMALLLWGAPRQARWTPLVAATLALLAPSLLFFPAEMLAVDAMPVLRLRPLALAVMLATLAMLPALLRELPAWGRLTLLPWLLWPVVAWLLPQVGRTLLAIVFW
jgi:hypothetical protein